ncbi:MAG: signal peptide peptidase SppA [Hyphomicrobiaceae bacterium]
MSFETESVLDRRRLRRKIGFWRSLAILAIVGVLAGTAFVTGGTKQILGRSQIARVTITGLITEDRKQLKLLRKIAKSDHVKGVLLFVNSPGGTTTGAEALFNEIRAISAKKPVVAQFGTVAASAAYIAGLATDHIVARGNSITGSVGVIMQWPEFTELLERVGIKVNEIKSGSLKAEPSPFKPESPEARQVSEEMIADGHKWFLDLVETRRQINPNTVPGLVEGRVYSGRSALRHKLIDQIGGENEAIRWMEEKRKVATGLSIVDWKVSDETQWLVGGSLSSFIADVFVRTTARLGETATTSSQLGRLSLDGLVAVWHPGKN